MTDKCWICNRSIEEIIKELNPCESCGMGCPPNEGMMLDVEVLGNNLKICCICNDYIYDRIAYITKCTLDEKLEEYLQNEYNRIWFEMIEDFHKCDCFEIGTHSVDIKSEMPITANNGFLVGYCDVVISLRLPDLYKGNYFKIIPSHGGDNSEKYIEVKPTIKSFGETLRQINTYKHYLHTDEMYLFTTYLRFKEAFESQGIKVLTYPDQ